MIDDILLHAEETGGLLYLHNSTVSILCTTVLCLLVPVLWLGLVILMSFWNPPGKDGSAGWRVHLYGFDQNIGASLQQQGVDGILMSVPHHPVFVLFWDWPVESRP